MIADTILHAIAVSAPWTTMKDYKFKMKVQPGKMSRGKATKLIMSMWKWDKKASPKFLEYIRLLNDVELT